MTALRRSQIPILHVAAEVAALPIASELSLRLGLVELDPRPVRQGPTVELWREGEPYLLRSFPGFSVDEIVAVRDRGWFREARLDQPVPLHQFVSNLALRYLQAVGNVAYPWLRYLAPNDDRADGDGLAMTRALEAEDRRAWRWMTFALPTDLLLASLRPEDPPRQVHLLSPLLEGMLREHRFAETHLHLGAALDFPMLWAAATQCIGSNDIPPGCFGSPGAEFRGGLDLSHWMIRSCIARFVLGCYLDWGQHVAAQTDFEQFLAPQGALDECIRSGGIGLADPLRDALREMYFGQLQRPERFRSLQRVYRMLTGVGKLKAPECLADVQWLDPLSRWFPPQGLDSPSVELQFLGRAFVYLGNNSHDAVFARLFWQTVRVRSLLYRHCVQRPLTPGLQYFIRFYERKGCLTRSLGGIELESAARLCGVDVGLKSLEVRISPRSNGDVQRSELKGLLRSYRKLRTDLPGGETLEFGVLLHFLKSRGKLHDAGTPAAFDAGGASDPQSRANPRRLRYSGVAAKWRAEVKAILTTLRRTPELIRLVRGFDICRDESSIPTWVYAPLFHHLTVEASKAANAGAQGLGRHHRVRLTTHVGEDFVHLLSGLRAMDEAFEHLQLRAGDRVGHGLALGFDAVAWARETVFVPMPIEDRWFDLIWEHQMLGGMGAEVSTRRLAAVEREIVDLAREIFTAPFHQYFSTPHASVRFVRMLYDEESMRAIGFPNVFGAPDQRISGRKEHEDQLNDEGVLIEYLTNPNLFRRARKVKWVKTSEEGESLAALQNALRRKFAANGITIETNPISNLLVGDLGDLESHPLWRLAPVRRDAQQGAPLSVCIGSDDPLPFVTNLPEEYQFLYDAIILAGGSHSDARGWLDRARVAGLEARFTLEPHFLEGIPFEAAAPKWRLDGRCLADRTHAMNWRDDRSRGSAGML